MRYPVKDGCFNEERGGQKPHCQAPSAASASTLLPSLEETMAGSRSLTRVLIIRAFCWEGATCCQVNGRWVAGLVGRRGTWPGSQAVS